MYLKLEIQLVSTTTYSLNDDAENAAYYYEHAYCSTEPGDFSVLEYKFIDHDNHYKAGYEIIGVDLA
jgi:hypothetical protein